MPPSSRARGILRHAYAPRLTTVRDAHHGSQMDEPFIINVAAAALALPIEGVAQMSAGKSA
jgi:hypothetical protein